MSEKKKLVASELVGIFDRIGRVYSFHSDYSNEGAFLGGTVTSKFINNFDTDLRSIADITMFKTDILAMFFRIVKQGYLFVPEECPEICKILQNLSKDEHPGVVSVCFAIAKELKSRAIALDSFCFGLEEYLEPDKSLIWLENAEGFGDF